MTVQIVAGSGTNQSAASLLASTWTGQATVLVATQTLTTGMTRYQFTGVVPANATQLAVLLSFTPSGTAGADNSFSINGVQFEIGAGASPFERIDAQVVLELCQRFSWVQPEPAAGVVIGAGANTGASSQLFYMATPVPLLKAPSVTVSAGTFKTNQAGVRDRDHDHGRRDPYAQRDLDQRQLFGNRRPGDDAAGRRRLRLDPGERGFLRTPRRSSDCRSRASPPNLVSSTAVANSHPFRTTR